MQGQTVDAEMQSNQLQNHYAFDMPLQTQDTKAQLDNQDSRYLISKEQSNGLIANKTRLSIKQYESPQFFVGSGTKEKESSSRMSMEFNHNGNGHSDSQVAGFEQQDGSFSKNAQDDLKANQQHMDLLKQK